MQLVELNDNFPSGFYEQFARLAIAFGRLEYLIKPCLKDFLGKGFTEGMAYAEGKHQFTKVCDRAEQEAQHHQRLTPRQKSTFSSIISQSKALADYRNDTIHACWTTEEGTGLPLRIRPKKGEHLQSADWTKSHPVRIEELCQKRADLEQLCQALHTEKQAWQLALPIQ